MLHLRVPGGSALGMESDPLRRRRVSQVQTCESGPGKTGTLVRKCWVRDHSKNPENRGSWYIPSCLTSNQKLKRRSWRGRRPKDPVSGPGPDPGSPRQTQDNTGGLPRPVVVCRNSPTQICGLGLPGISGLASLTRKRGRSARIGTAPSSPLPVQVAATPFPSRPDLVLPSLFCQTTPTGVTHAMGDLGF